MQKIEQSVEVNQPVRLVYNQWTRFEEFPKFMEGVKSVRQIDGKRLLWEAEIAGKRKTWQAEVLDQIPDQRIAWRSTSGTETSGAILFDPLDEERTKISLELNYRPVGLLENVADKFGVISSRVSRDLVRFKEYVETSFSQPEGWRDKARPGSTPASKADYAESSDAF